VLEMLIQSSSCQQLNLSMTQIFLSSYQCNSNGKVSYGVTGITALKGMHQIPKENLPTKENRKTLVVSSAAGSTGSFAL